MSRAKELHDSVKGLTNKSFTRGPLRIKVNEIILDDENNLLMVWVAATRDNRPIILNLPLAYVNPPLMAGGKTDHDLAFKDMVAETVDLF